MDQDIDMDAPEISTLKDEETPPPQSKASGSGRRNKTKVPPAWPRPRRPENLTDDEYDEVEEEEDQLIDDDEDELMKPVPVTALPNPSRSGEGAAKKRASNKRKPRKSEKRQAEDERKAQEKAMTNTSGPIELAPTVTWFEATPSGPHDSNVKQSVSAPVGQSKVGTPTKAPKKSIKRTKMVPTKLKTVVPLLDDTGGLSEAHTGTAASSPVTIQFDAVSPDPEGTDLTGTLAPIPLTEETNLEDAPLPQYPLPTKPFPVQPAPKIPTGFAPVLPLDKSKKKVRHWRMARREIRGIAGGRWFATTWVGEKESEYASNVPKPGEDRLSGVPRSSAVSISAPVKSKAKVKAMSSLAASAAPSRSGSSVPDVPQTTARPQTKMRNTVTATQSEGDSVVTPGS
ncbi:hypothetical protein C0993_005729 [Termitomyces sp. T159_Od127]|nr:hypothetical protein C0993_005729 [Termitomyces sp. T159_Od127]